MMIKVKNKTQISAAAQHNIGLFTLLRVRYLIKYSHYFIFVSLPALLELKCVFKLHMYVSLSVYEHAFTLVSASS